MTFRVGERVRAAFAAPRYLVPPPSGLDVSTSGVKAVRLAATAAGITLASYAQIRLDAGAYADGEILDRNMISAAIATAAKQVRILSANAALPEPKSYLFETTAAGTEKAQWLLAVEQHLDEYIPLSPADAAFDVVGDGPAGQGGTRLAGVGFAHRVVDETLAVFDAAHIGVRALESETFAMGRALLRPDDTSTVLIVDVGKTTTKMAVLERRIPRFATTIGIGGHALTLAVQKHFGVTEPEARRIKADRGIVPTTGNEDYLAAMLSTVSAIRDELARRLQYWQERVAVGKQHEPISRILLVGGNASLRGFPEYLEGALRVPVAAGDVFTNFAPRSAWLPSLDYGESLAYATAIGLALRDFSLPYGN